MKTFEEQLTAWIDGCLGGEELAAFERELARRPDADALRAEKRDAGRLRALLREHAAAASPALTHLDFFNHQIRQRIEAEPPEKVVERLLPAVRRRLLEWFGAPASWPLPARLAGIGFVCLLLALAGFQTLIPPRNSTPKSLAGGPPKQSPPAAVELKVPAPTPPAPAPSPEETRLAVAPAPAPPASANPTAPGQPTEMAMRQAPKDEQLAEILDARVPPGATSATAVHFDEQNADVIWLNGLDYLPEIASDSSKK